MGLEDSGVRRTLVERGGSLDAGGRLDAGDSVKVAGYLSRDVEF